MGCNQRWEGLELFVNLTKPAAEMALHLSGQLLHQT
jgi:hypothetical protein